MKNFLNSFKKFGLLELLVIFSAVYVVSMLLWTASTRSAVEEKANTVKSNHKQIVDFINTEIELVRKLSFTLQLSHHDDYEGGNVQFMNEMGKSYFAPRKRGTMIIFDSRLNHRVCKVTKGVRKSIVGWCIGPRWR